MIKAEGDFHAALIQHSESSAGSFRFISTARSRGYSAWKTMSKSSRLAVVKMMS
jgi:hypothetical protein